MKFPYQQAKIHVLEAGHYPCHSRLCISKTIFAKGDIPGCHLLF